jgi:hypothetical protein
MFCPEHFWNAPNLLFSNRFCGLGIMDAESLSPRLLCFTALCFHFTTQKRRKYNNDDLCPSVCLFGVSSRKRLADFDEILCELFNFVQSLITTL